MLVRGFAPLAFEGSFNNHLPSSGTCIRGPKFNLGRKAFIIAGS